MGLDLAFGKGEKAVGGILLRSLMPVKVTENDKGELVAHVSNSKEDFTEGPCNCVRAILATTKPKDWNSDPMSLHGEFGIKDVVSQKDFSLNAFDTKSCMHLLCDSEENPIKIPEQQIMKCPRVGLTLKRYDKYKEKQFWMADYRFMAYPAF